MISYIIIALPSKLFFKHITQLKRSKDLKPGDVLIARIGFDIDHLEEQMITILLISKTDIYFKINFLESQHHFYALPNEKWRILT